MSTVPEAIAAKVEGIEFFAISVITNEAAGLSNEILDHSDVKDVAEIMAPKFEELVCRIMPRLYELDPAPIKRAAPVKKDMLFDPNLPHTWNASDIHVYASVVKQLGPAGVRTAVWGSARFVDELKDLKPLSFAIKIPALTMPVVMCNQDVIVVQTDTMDSQSAMFWTSVLATAGITKIVFPIACASLGVPVPEVAHIGPMYIHDLAAIPAFNAPTPCDTVRSYPQGAVKAFAVAPPTVPTAAEVGMALNLGCSVTFASNACPMLCCEPLGLQSDIIAAVESQAPRNERVKHVSLTSAITSAIDMPAPHASLACPLPQYKALRQYRVREDLEKPRMFAQAAVQAVKDVADRYSGMGGNEFAVVANKMFESELPKIVRNHDDVHDDTG